MASSSSATYSRRCAVCGVAGNLLACGSCRMVEYCSKEHQVTDWPHHRRLCGTRAIEERAPNDSRAADPSVEAALATVDALTAALSIAGSQFDDFEGVEGSEDRTQISQRAEQLSAPLSCQHSSSLQLPPSTLGPAGALSPAANQAAPQQQGRPDSRGSGVSDDGDASSMPAVSPVAGTGSRRGSLGSVLGGAVGAALCSPERQQKLERQAQDVKRCLDKFGVCVINDFLGATDGDLVLAEVQWLDESGAMRSGQTTQAPAAGRAAATTASASAAASPAAGAGDDANAPARRFRGDKIAWVTGLEPSCRAIGNLVSQMDSLLRFCNCRLGDYHVDRRTKAMAACYPGNGARYVKHVDNPNADGRCVTAIYYVNKNWSSKEHGGVLKIYSEVTKKVASIEPVFDRLLFFWSDKRNPHEVLPAYRTRYAITVWYFDAEERQRALLREESLRRLREQRASSNSSSCSNSSTNSSSSGCSDGHQAGGDRGVVGDCTSTLRSDRSSTPTCNSAPKAEQRDEPT